VAGYVLHERPVGAARQLLPPAGRFKCLDGFLGVGAAGAAGRSRAMPRSFKLEVRINGELKQTLDFADLVRPPRNCWPT
jgi:5-oxopent-3-ene-1,2,5-tricarboxylate decarboxylase/2-hydroxyhepta-2,4-diene-1,7-dioate isomerase